MKAEGKGSKAPLTDSFLRYPNNKYVLLALLGATAGQGVVWYTGQFYALFFLQITLKLDYLTTYTLIGASLLLGTPFFVFFGWLSDKIGRLKIILAGCLIAALTYFPLFQGADALREPGARGLPAAGPRSRSRSTRPTCNFHLFVGPVEQVLRLRPDQGLPDQAGPVLRRASTGAPGSAAGRDQIGGVEIAGLQRASAITEALKAQGYPAAGRTRAGSTTR